MNKLLRVACAAGAVALLWGSSGCVSARKTASVSEPGMDAQSRLALAEQVVSGWSDTPRLAARLLIKRYGAPDEVGSSRLIWNGNGPWKRTIVRDLPEPYASTPGEDLGVIEQTVAYRVTPEQVAALEGLGDRLMCDAPRMEMSSRSDREEVNFLRLNLANDVVRRMMTGAEAQESYLRALALDASGKTQQYMLSLRFGLGP